MASGFFALLDDIATIAKTAAASLDDVAVQAAQASKKAAGIVIDDAAVTPRYVVGFAANRELPIIARIALGSLKNKLLFLLPGALALTFLAPWSITPLLMLGGAYLCFEGYEKVHALMHPTATVLPAAAIAAAPGDPAADEDRKVASAVRTDFILSAEIMAITMASIQSPELWIKAVTLALVGILVTLAVYGVVALIVKADDVGLHLAQTGRSTFVRSFGSGLVRTMPSVLSMLSFIGMLAMLWVGGGIVLHGLEEYGIGALPHAIHDIAKAVGNLLGPAKSFATWIIDATAAGLIGLAIGWALAFAAQRTGISGH
jgi:hypothetical protein